MKYVLPISLGKLICSDGKIVNIFSCYDPNIKINIAVLYYGHTKLLNETGYKRVCEI